MPNQSTLLQVVIHSKYGGQGWSDKFYLPQTTFDSASITARQLAIWRSAALAPGGQVCWARMSFVDTPRNTIACLNQPLLAATYAGSTEGPIEDVYTALHWRFETADGHWANRLIRGIPDDVVREMQIQPNIAPTWQPYGPTSALPDPDDLSNPYPNMVLAFLEYARRVTIWAKLGPGPTVNFDTMPWAKVIFRKVANRQTGVAFGMTRGRARKRTPVAP